MANNKKRKKKKLFEPTNNEELLRGWLLHAHKGRDRHDLAARSNNTQRYVLGVPAIILSTIVGTSVFATLETQVNPWIRILIGLVSITSAVLASLQTFFNFAGLAENHRSAGVKYKAIIRELEQILTKQHDKLPEDAEFYDGFRKRLDELESEAPVVPDRIYSQVEENYYEITIAEDVFSLVKRD